MTTPSGTPEKKPPLRIDIHQGVETPEEMRAVLQIEKDCFGNKAWGLDHFLSRDPTEFPTLVATYNNEVVGYAAGQRQDDAIELLRIAIRPKNRGQQVGAQLIEKMREKLLINVHSYIHLTIADHNTDAVRFFTSKSCGFEVAEINHDNGTYRLEDYKFKHLPRAKRLGQVQHALKNITCVDWDIVQATTAGHYIEVKEDKIKEEGSAYAVRTKQRLKIPKEMLRSLAHFFEDTHVPSKRLTSQFASDDPIHLTINEGWLNGKDIRKALDSENNGKVDMSLMALNDRLRIRDARQVERF